MLALRPRETVILAEDFSALVNWYRDVLEFTIVASFSDAFHYACLETPSGIKIGIASAQEMGVVPGDRSGNTVLLQFEVDELHAFFVDLKQAHVTVTFGPAQDKQDSFWYGGFEDPEGNPIRVVDRNCP